MLTIKFASLQQLLFTRYTDLLKHPEKYNCLEKKVISIAHFIFRNIFTSYKNLKKFKLSVNQPTQKSKFNFKLTSLKFSNCSQFEILKTHPEPAFETPRPIKKPQEEQTQVNQTAIETETTNSEQQVSDIKEGDQLSSNIADTKEEQNLSLEEKNNLTNPKVSLANSKMDLHRDDKGKDLAKKEAFYSLENINLADQKLKELLLKHTTESNKDGIIFLATALKGVKINSFKVEMENNSLSFYLDIANFATGKAYTQGKEGQPKELPGFLKIISKNKPFKIVSSNNEIIIECNQQIVMQVSKDIKVIGGTTVPIQSFVIKMNAAKERVFAVKLAGFAINALIKIAIPIIKAWQSSNCNTANSSHQIDPQKVFSEGIPLIPIVYNWRKYIKWKDCERDWTV